MQNLGNKISIIFSGNFKLWGLGLRLYCIFRMGAKRLINTGLLRVTTARGRHLSDALYLNAVLMNVFQIISKF